MKNDILANFKIGSDFFDVTHPPPPNEQIASVRLARVLRQTYLGPSPPFDGSIASILSRVRSADRSLLEIARQILVIP
jgi:hypothetical protein